MLPNQFRISKKATDTLAMMKGRTGITPNILARLAIAHALESNSLSQDITSTPGDQILHTSTLFGEHAEMYAMLIRQQSEGIDISKAVTQLIDNGLGIFTGVNNLNDLFIKCKEKVA